MLEAAGVDVAGLNLDGAFAVYVTARERENERENERRGVGREGTRKELSRRKSLHVTGGGQSNAERGKATRREGGNFQQKGLA